MTDYMESYTEAEQLLAELDALDARSADENEAEDK